jgi:hypothetical protein
MDKKSVKRRRWQGREPKDSLGLVGKTGWIIRDGIPTKGIVLVESDGEVVVTFDMEIFKDTEVFKTKRDLIRSLPRG